MFEKFEYGENEEKHLSKISKLVNEFTNRTELPIYFMLIPNSIYINQDKLPDNVEVYNQREIIQNFYNQLNDRIEKIQITDLLMANKNEYIYFKTDHHMTSLGAYIAYAAFTTQKGEMPVDIRELDKITVSQSFLGTFDSKAQIYNQEVDRIDIYLNEKNIQMEEVQYDDERAQSIFNEQYLNKKDKYSFFLNGNNAKVIVKTKLKNGKKLLLIKDSYAHIMAQFLCQDYEEIHFIDPRYYKISLTEYSKENKITEVLFLYNVSNLVSDLGLLTLK